MRAAVIEEQGKPLVVTEVPDPEPGPGELIVEVGACGICGSDLHLSQHVPSPGLILGHEYAGEVVEVGADVSRSRVGELVAGFPLIGCRQCDACRAGDWARCPVVRQLGVGEAGAYARYARVADAGAFTLPPGCAASTGALVEPFAVALHALDRTPRTQGDPVLVLGGGPVGLAVAIWARVFGATDVVVSDPVAARRQVAERVAGAATIDPISTDVAEGFHQITGRPPRTIIECVGVPGVIQSAAMAAAYDGHITVVGVCMEPDPWLPVVAMMKEVTMSFVIYYRHDDFQRTIRAIDSGVLDPSPLVTDTIGLDELPARFEALRHPTDEAKILIDPSR